MRTDNIVALVTGASSGIGRATAIRLAELGCTVYGISRRSVKDDNITHLSADITKSEEIDSAVKEIISKEGKIDLLINNAGMGISGSVEFTELNSAKKLFDVNFFGMVTVTNAVLPYMRKARKGKIVNISSVAALVPIPFQTFYSASKAAINSYTMALANEVKPFGISAVAIMPGDICSGFTEAREKSSKGDEAYGGRIESSVRTMEKDEQSGMKPEKAAKIISRMVLSKSKKPLRAVGIAYKGACFLAKLLPSSMLNKIIGMLYAK